LLPFPSDFYKENGYLSFLEESLPINEDDIPLSPSIFAHMDGFSVGSTLAVAFPTATLEGVVQWPNLAPFEDLNVQTIIIDTNTGTRIPHTVEREVLVSNNALLMLRPMIPLIHETTYVVGIRNLVDEEGNTVEPTQGFLDVLSGETENIDILRQRETYEQLILPALQEEGFTKEELQIAWSFSTRSAENTRAPIEHMRAQIDARTEPIEFSIETIEEEDCSANRGRVIKGEMQTLLFLEEWTGMFPLVRDEDGLPTTNGMVSVPFSVLIGCALIEEQRPGKLLQYGHGLFGTQGELTSGYNHTLANTYGWVMFAADWTGMKRQDAPNITFTLIQNPSGFSYLTDRLHQGWMEFYTLTKLMRSESLRTGEPFLQDGVALIDPSGLYYYGNSQGSVLGGGYVAMHPEIERAVLSVGGMPLNLILNRAEGFSPFLQLMETMYRDSSNITVMEILFEQLWEPVESVGWASVMNKPILIQAAIGDKGVPTIGAHVMARAYGATLIEPFNREVWGLSSEVPPFQGSAFTEWDYGVLDSDGPFPAPSDGSVNPHDAVRNEEEAQHQIHTFLESGIVENYCNGACSGL
jgi:hypothetical protein